MTYLISWDVFCVAFGILLLMSLVMSLQGRGFFTQDPVKKSFSIMELQFPASPRELTNIIRGMYRLPRADAKLAVRSLRGQLLADFLFMPAAYGSIFLLCMLTAQKLETGTGSVIFRGLAWAQVISWLCDVTENIYLLRKISPYPKRSSAAVHRKYIYMEVLKWGLALTGLVSALSALSYFWLSRDHNPHSLRYLLYLAVEIVLFVVAGKVLSRKRQKTTA